MPSEVFQNYKPLRNYMRQFDVDTSLYSIWAHSKFLQMNDAPIQSDVEYPNQYVAAVKKNNMSQIKWRVWEWDLETLAREAIINSTYGSSKKKCMLDWKYLAGSNNKLLGFSNFLSEKYVSRENVLQEMWRLLHREFPWQESRPSQEHLIRYWKIYGQHPKIAKAIENFVGIPAEKYYLVSMLLFGHYITYFRTDEYPDIRGLDLTQEEYQIYNNWISQDFETIKKYMLKEQSLSDKYLYTFNPLRYWPLIRVQYQNKNFTICPMVTLFFWRVTGGIYFDVVKESLDNELGESFQSYTGEVLSRSYTLGPILSEEKYGKKDQNDSIDWIAVDDKSSVSAALFIECKCKRLPLKSTMELDYESSMDEQLDLMVEMIVQVYNQVNDYTQGLLPHFFNNIKRKIYPVVVTMEPWFLFGDRTIGEINKRLEQIMVSEGLDVNMLQEYPWTVCSISDFEVMMQVINSVGISGFFEPRSQDRELQLWNIYSYMYQQFHESVNNARFLFPESMQEMIPIPMKE